MDTIAAGAFPVPIEKWPASRQTDKTVHGGVIMGGCTTVLIGLAGTVGNVLVGTAACNNATSGRSGGNGQQSYNNCGVESSRQIINQANHSNIGEDQLLTDAINAGNANGTPGAPPTFNDGGTTAAGRQSILAANGLASTILPTTAENLGVSLGQGSGVIVSLDAANLWGPPTPAGSFHAVMVTGVEYDDAGNRTAVIINDTGTGTCGQRVDPATFDAAVAARGNSRLNVTTDAIW